MIYDETIGCIRGGATFKYERGGSAIELRIPVELTYMKYDACGKVLEAQAKTARDARLAAIYLGIEVGVG